MRAIREDARIYYIPYKKMWYVGLLNMRKSLLRLLLCNDFLRFCNLIGCKSKTS